MRTIGTDDGQEVDPATLRAVALGLSDWEAQQLLIAGQFAPHLPACSCDADPAGVTGAWDDNGALMLVVWDEPEPRRPWGLLVLLAVVCGLVLLWWYAKGRGT